MRNRCSTRAFVCRGRRIKKMNQEKENAMRTLLLVAGGVVAIALATPAFARTHHHAHSSYDAYAAERLPEVRVYAPRENPGYVPQQYPGYPGYYDAYGAYRG